MITRAARRALAGSWLAAAAAATACSPGAATVWLDLPGLPPAAQTIVVAAFDAAGGSPRAELHARASLAAARLRFELGEEESASVGVAALDVTPAELQLEEGPLRRPAPDEAPRALPPALAHWTRAVGADAAGAWAEGDRGARLASLRVPPLDWAACAQAGGCFVPAPEGADREVCTLPCPEPAAPVAPAAPSDPAAPSLPDLTPCPSGWGVIGAPSAEGAPLCAPSSVRILCPSGQYHPPSAPDCVDLGAACPAGDWPDALPAGRPTLYVSAGAAPGGDGSRAAPFATLAAALAHVAPGDGTVLALARGRHTGPAELPDGVRIQGACAGETAVESPGAAFRVAAGRAELRDLRVLGAGGALRASAGGVLDLAGVAVEAAAGAAVLAEPDGAIYARGLSVTGGDEGVVARGGAAWLEAVQLHGLAEAGLRASAGGRIEAADVVIRATGARRASSGAAAVDVAQGSEGRLSASLIEATAGTSAVVGGAGATLDLTDVLVRAGLATAPAAAGGVLARAGATLRARRVAFVDVGSASVRLDGAHATLEDVVVRAASSAGPEAAALELRGAATASIARAAIAGARGPALALSGGARATVTDLTSADARGSERMDIAVEDAALSLARAVSARSGVGGLYAVGAGAAVLLRDLYVRDVVAGGGLAVAGGATLDAARVAVAQVRTWGLLVTDARTRAALEDLRVEGVRNELGIDEDGRCAYVEGAALSLTRARLSDCSGAGLGADGVGAATLEASDVEILRASRGASLDGAGTQATFRRARVEAAADVGVYVGGDAALLASDLEVVGTGAGGLGAGVRAASTSGVSLLRFALRDNASLGLELERGAGSLGRCLLDGGRIGGSPIGAALPAQHAHVRDLVTRVRYERTPTALSPR